MTVDLDAIARRGHCEVSSLRNALPLLQQGFSPPFLARYRRDELGGIDEGSLWALADAVASEQAIADHRDQLSALWEQTPLADPSLGHAIRKSNSKRMLERLARRLKAESAENITPSEHLAVRVLNPRKGDGDDFAAIAEKLESVSDAAAAVEGLDQALAQRLAGDPRVINAAVKWLSKHARILIANISDPHTPGNANEQDHGDENAAKTSQRAAATNAAAAVAANPETPQTGDANEVETAATASDAAGETTAVAADDNAPTATATEPASVVAESESAQEKPVAATDTVVTPTAEASTPDAPTPDAPTPDAPTPDAPTPDAPTPDAPAPDAPTPDAPTPDASTPDASTPDAPTSEATTPAEPSAADPTTAEQATPAPAEGGPAAKTAAPAAKAAKVKQASGKPKSPKKAKKISPRQRRRRWLVSVLKPLAGKKFAANKLSAFQIVMLGRALRSQVAECSFDYDASKLVAEIQRTVSGINRHVEAKLNAIVLEHEASIREAAEAAWWDELHERASTRLVGIAADHLRKHINRGSVQAGAVMSIDAVGPRTAATSIVSADGRVLHCEDLPCQLSATLRSQAVAKMGELIHTYHVDLIVISNGPARRACMIALGDLIRQSPEQSLRWTLADRTGADAYAGSDVSNEEMGRTPRRFRAAAWLAFSVLQPAQAFAKVDPLKLRLASFQRELADPALAASLENVVVSGASRGGVDVNSASTEWLGRLPGMTSELAKAIDARRRESLLTSREEVLELDAWNNVVESRQALPFLRVFGSDDPMDGTLIHPDDYPLAKKLAKSLEIELPPASPPGYEPPTFESDEQPKTEPALSETTSEVQTPQVEDLSAAAEKNASASFAENVEAEQSDADDTEPAAVTPEAEQATAADTQSSEVAAPSESAADSDQPVAPTEAAEAETADTEAANTETADTGTTDTETESPADSSESTEQPTAEAPAAAQVEPPPEPIRRPRPEQAKIDKCIKEWQIGARRANQLVNWLCDPFGDSDVSGNPPAVLTMMPAQSTLKPGDEVIGVVVGVMPFGVFVELAPDCSGLIHVSKVSDKFVEDLHEAIQVGDVVTAWVTGIDQKKRRVALSAISPQREEELQHERQQSRTRGGGRPPRGGGDQRGRAAGKPAAQRGGGQERGARPAGARPAGGKPAGGKPSGGRPAGGRGDSRGRGRGEQRRGGRREKKPETYRVESKKESAPISDAMKQGNEPLRSFGDLMQFYKEDEAPQASPPQQQKPKAETASPPPVANETPAAEPSASNETPAAAIVPAESERTESAPAAVKPVVSEPANTPAVETPTASPPEQAASDEAPNKSPAPSDTTPS